MPRRSQSGVRRRDGAPPFDDAGDGMRGAHAEQDKYVYRHKWRMGDVVVWDNTGTMHRVQPYSKDSGRMMHRVTLVGEEPLAA